MPTTKEDALLRMLTHGIARARRHAHNEGPRHPIILIADGDLDFRELRDHLSYHHNVPVGPVSIMEDSGAELLAEHRRQTHRRVSASHYIKHERVGGVTWAEQFEKAVV
jgi:hypothetical protein